MNIEPYFPFAHPAGPWDALLVEGDGVDAAVQNRVGGHEHDSEPVGEVHPKDRPVEPEHPMMLDGGVVPGDVELMARCMIDEMLLLGTSADEIAAMARTPEYQAFFAARHAMGAERFEAVLRDASRRLGRHRHRTVEAAGDTRSVTLTVRGRDGADPTQE